MPVEFLTEQQKSQYGKYYGVPNEIQLAKYFHLDDSDKAFIAERRGDQNKLGFALQLTSVRFLGTFLSDVRGVPESTRVYVANQLAIEDISILDLYAQRETTRREHNALIRIHYGFYELSDPPWAFRLGRFIYTKAWLTNEKAKPAVRLRYFVARAAQGATSRGNQINPAHC